MGQAKHFIIKKGLLFSKNHWNFNVACCCATPRFVYARAAIDDRLERPRRLEQASQPASEWSEVTWMKCISLYRLNLLRAMHSFSDTVNFII